MTYRDSKYIFGKIQLLLLTYFLLKSMTGLLSLISLTSERPCQDRGEGVLGAPLSILALEQIFAQKSCFPKSWHQFQFIWPLFRMFFPKITKNWLKLEIYQKIAATMYCKYCKLIYLKNGIRTYRIDFFKEMIRFAA